MPRTYQLEAEGDQMRQRQAGPARPLIAVAAETRRLIERQPAGLCSALARAGHAPILLDFEDPASAPLHVIDLIVARGRSASLLALLARAEGMGARTVNRCSAIASVRDKASLSKELANGGLPTPATVCGSVMSIAVAFGPDDYPLVVKPRFGEEARGTRVVRSRAELLQLDWLEPFAIAQRLVPSDGFDLKLSVIGGWVYAVRRPSPVTGSAAAPTYAVQVTPALRALALRCGLLFGLELYSVSCVETAAGPMVVGVDDFPDYAGIAGADDRLARFVIERAQAAFERKRA